jgi:hypothetical protein
LRQAPAEAIDSGLLVLRLGKQERERGLIALDHTSIAPLVAGLVVSVGQDYRIEVRRGFDLQLLAEVVQALGAEARR